MANMRRTFWQYIEPLAAPLLLVALALPLWIPISSWLEGHDRFDREVLREWIQEAKLEGRSLRSLIRDYIVARRQLQQTEAELRRWKQSQQLGKAKPGGHGWAATIKGLRDRMGTAVAAGKPGQDDVNPAAVRARPENGILFGFEMVAVDKTAVTNKQWLLESAREEYIGAKSALSQFLRWLAEPITKVERERIPLFPVIYRMEVGDHASVASPFAEWDSHWPRKTENIKRFYHTLQIDPDTSAYVAVDYVFRVYASQQDLNEQKSRRQIFFSSLAALAVTLALFWGFILVVRARRRRWQQMLAEKEINEAKRRQLEFERATLELRSQLWANIGIMAGSYAHNIKNLLVRPNDLLSRCLERNTDNSTQRQMLSEVRQTLGTVTERLQQILQTVRRDPTQAQVERIDVKELLDNMYSTWADLARDKWQLEMKLDLPAGPLYIQADRSHLQQALENLIFNARDATFEKRNHLREQARRQVADDDPDAARRRRDALIEAARWRGEITLRAYRDASDVVIEITDNGIGMTEEVRRRCTETYFSTKRDNALFAGMSAGMGLGLSFIQTILGHLKGKMDIDTTPLEGTTIRLRFPSEPQE